MIIYRALESYVNDNFADTANVTTRYQFSRTEDCLAIIINSNSNIRPINIIIAFLYHTIFEEDRNPFELTEQDICQFMVDIAEEHMHKTASNRRTVYYWPGLGD